MVFFVFLEQCEEKRQGIKVATALTLSLGLVLSMFLNLHVLLLLLQMKAFRYREVHILSQCNVSLKRAVCCFF